MGNSFISTSPRSCRAFLHASFPWHLTPFNRTARKEASAKLRKWTEASPAARRSSSLAMQLKMVTQTSCGSTSAVPRLAFILYLGHSAKGLIKEHFTTSRAALKMPRYSSLTHLPWLIHARCIHPHQCWSWGLVPIPLWAEKRNNFCQLSQQSRLERVNDVWSVP